MTKPQNRRYTINSSGVLPIGTVVTIVKQAQDMAFVLAEKGGSAIVRLTALSKWKRRK